MTREKMINRLVNRLDEIGALDKDNYNCHEEQLQDVHTVIENYLEEYTLVKGGIVY